MGLGCNLVLPFPSHHLWQGNLLPFPSCHQGLGMEMTGATPPLHSISPLPPAFSHSSAELPGPGRTMAGWGQHQEGVAECFCSGLGTRSSVSVSRHLVGAGCRDDKLPRPNLTSTMCTTHSLILPSCPLAGPLTLQFLFCFRGGWGGPHWG